MTAQYLYSSAKRNTALAAIGGDTMGQIEVDLLKQVLVATVASGGGGGGAAAWGSITGTLSAQTDLQTALDAKLNLTGGTMTGQLILQNASATGAVNVSPTWNNAGTNFAGIYGRVTNTASGASSKLIDIGTVAGGSLFSVDKAGKLLATGYYFGNTAYGFDGSTGWGMGWVSNSATVCLANDNIGQKHFAVAQAGGIGFQGSTEWYPDTVLFRSSAGRIALRNNTGYIQSSIYPSVIAQAFEVYNTYTNGTNYERFAIDWQSSSNIVKIGTQVGGSGGTARDIEIVTDNTARITIKASGEILLAGLPITYPGVSGQLWNDEGTVKISS